MNLAVKVKERADVELATDNFIGILQHTAKETTPTRNPQRPINNLPSEVKKLVAVKQKARSPLAKNPHAR